GEHRSEKRRALLDRPVLLQGADIVGRQLADIAVGARHFEKAAVPGAAARILFEFHFAARHAHATLAQRDDQLRRLRVITHRLPVVAALGAGTDVEPMSDLLLQYVAAISRFS